MSAEEGRVLVKENIRSRQKVQILEGERRGRERAEESGGAVAGAKLQCTSRDRGGFLGGPSLAKEGCGHHDCDGRGDPDPHHHPASKKNGPATLRLALLLVDGKAQPLLKVLAKAHGRRIAKNRRPDREGAVVSAAGGALREMPTEVDDLIREEAFVAKIGISLEKVEAGHRLHSPSWKGSDATSGT
jgi:hypothetical protein